LLTAIAGLPAFLAFLLLVYSLARDFSLQNLGLALLAFSVLPLVLISRAYTVRLQDRIIRTEMQLRLDRLGRGGDIGRVTPKQLTALRFAPDGELPGLLDRAIAESLTPDQIKRAVKDWQPDWMRT
jgi:hypothetical protein